jgi:hypothetical protein
MKRIWVIVCVLLSGCVNSSFIQAVGDWHDKEDPCQYKGKDPGYQLPSFCGASRGRTYISNVNGKTIAVIRK